MLKKMKSRQLDLPDHLGLTPGCVALLRRLLEPEPETRVTITDIMRDPWFCEELPAGAGDMNATYLGLPPLTAQSADDIRAVVAAVRAGA
jgi:serine/threonine-protein kinase SRK2